MERTSHHTQVATFAAFAVYYDYTSEFPHDTLILKIFLRVIIILVIKLYDIHQHLMGFDSRTIRINGHGL